MTIPFRPRRSARRRQSSRDRSRRAVYGGHRLARLVVLADRATQNTVPLDQRIARQRHRTRGSLRLSACDLATAPRDVELACDARRAVRLLLQLGGCSGKRRGESARGVAVGQCTVVVQAVVDDLVCSSRGPRYHASWLSTAVQHRVASQLGRPAFVVRSAARLRRSAMTGRPAAHAVCTPSRSADALRAAGAARIIPARLSAPARRTIRLCSWHRIAVRNPLSRAKFRPLTRAALNLRAFCRLRGRFVTHVASTPHRPPPAPPTPPAG